MASTRNKNTSCNYELEQKRFRQFESYTLYPNSSYGAAVNTQFCGNGLLPAKIPWNKLSHNASDTEAFLFGINSTNLVTQAPIFTPEIAQLSSVNIYEKGVVYLPEPLVIEKGQRPQYLP